MRPFAESADERERTGQRRPQLRGQAILHAMRNGQNKRMRGRNRKSHNPLTRIYESNGPDVKIRGTATHIAEKFLQLARDAQSGGDPIAAENYFQHAEHYFRLIAAAQEQFRQTNPFYRPESVGDMRDDFGDDGDEEAAGASTEQPPVGMRDPQPYLPREQQPYPPRDAPYYGPREQQGGFARENAGREQQSYSRHPPSRPPRPAEDEGSVERLPTFITGAAPAPGASAPPSQAYGPNGFDGQGDRFALHRRRRRHRGPRGEVTQSGPATSESEETSSLPPPGGE
jgi:Domain of unknown function (DUF4167)